ncbi:MAG TPA: hypothetical protein VK302_09370 [Terriglobales bacterium]|nr:hypothetical protein [Terriglobales bacterium]
MRNTLVWLILMLGVVALGRAQFKQTTLLPELVLRQREGHSAIGWADAGRLQFIVFGQKPRMQSYTLPGPPLWGASLHGPSGQIFGDIVADGKHAFGAVLDGKVLWEDPDLVVQGNPEISQDGKRLLLEGRDKKTGAKGLLVVEEQGQKVTQISHEGKNPSWSSDDAKFVYEENDVALIYDLRSKEKQRVGSGTWPSWSPDGKWISYRNPEGRFVLVDAGGQTTRTLFDGKNVLTPLHWSPDSEYFMYVVKTGAWRGFNCLDAKDIIVYRLQDGQSDAVYGLCEGYPYSVLQWFQLPSKVPLD